MNKEEIILEIKKMFPNNNEVSVGAVQFCDEFDGFSNALADGEGVSQELETSFINLIDEWVWKNIFRKAENQIDLEFQGCTIELIFHLNENKITYNISYTEDEYHEIEHPDKYSEIF